MKMRGARNETLHLSRSRLCDGDRPAIGYSLLYLVYGGGKRSLPEHGQIRVGAPTYPDTFDGTASREGVCAGGGVARAACRPQRSADTSSPL
jgi:hypothetical protein